MFDHVTCQSWRLRKRGGGGASSQMPSNQWHISDQPVFAQRLHNSSSERKQKHRFQYCAANMFWAIPFTEIKWTFFGEICRWGYRPPTIGGILVGRNDYGWVRRKKNPRFRVLQPVKWKQTHPSSWWHHLVGGSAKVFAPNWLETRIEKCQKNVKAETLRQTVVVCYPSSIFWQLLADIYSGKCSADPIY